MAKSIKVTAILALALFIVPLISPIQTYAQSVTYTMRDLRLDTLGKTIYLNENSENKDGTLTEYVNGKSVKNWKIKYEQKGSSRMMCQPPVLNISFDKKDSKGRAKELFTGISTFGSYSQLQYQKVRLIPECDLWNDYSIHGSGSGFNGQQNVNLTEYIVFKIFRMFGIPTADIIGFTNISFVAPDEGYTTGKTFRYMIVQRPAEQDDQIPFSRQYNLNPDYYESGEYESVNRTWQLANYQSNPLEPATIVHNNGTKVEMNFDKTTTLKYLLLTKFLNLQDMGALHNEDWAIDLSTNLTKIIPHGFDMSLTCNLNTREFSDLVALINEMPPEVRPEYQSILYKVSREIFGDQNSLDKMLGAVAIFPYNTNKDLLNNFLKLQFYRYSKYANSKQFADDLNQSYIEKPYVLPYTAEEYYLRLANFNSSCNKTRDEVDSNIHLIGKPKLSNNTNEASLFFDFEIMTKDQPLELLKPELFSSVFTARIIDNSSDFNRYIEINYSSDSEVVQNDPGPYLRIPAHSKVNFKAIGTIDPAQFINSNYTVVIDSFKPNSYTKEFMLDAKSNSINLGKLKPIDILSPKTNEKLNRGADFRLAWSGSNNESYQITLTNKEEFRDQYYITNPSGQSFFETGELTWKVGQIYSWDNGWKTKMLPPGKYVLNIRYDPFGETSRSVDIDIVADDSYREPVLSIIGSPILKLIYGQLGREERLIANYKIQISAGDNDQYLLKNYAFVAYLTGKGFDRNFGTQNYSGDRNLESYDNNYYVIRAGNTTVIDLNISFDPQILIAGNYHVDLNSLALGNSGPYTYVLPDENSKSSTNSLVIIGERAPYILSVPAQAIPANKEISISGIRFSTTTSNIVALKSATYECPAGFVCDQSRQFFVESKDGKTLTFVSNMPSGSYLIQVSLPDVGASNVAIVTISAPTIFQSIKPDKEKVLSDQKVVLNYLIPQGAIGAKLKIYCPAEVTVLENDKDICNNMFAFDFIPKQTSLKLVNTATWPQYILPSLYVYYDKDASFVISTTSKILILPRVATTTVTPPPSANPGLVGTSSVMRLVLSATKQVYDRTISKLDTILSTTPSPSPSVIPASRTTPSVSPSPSASSTVKPTSTASPSVSPSILPTVRISPSATPTASSKPTPTPSISAKPSVSISPSPSKSPTPTPMPATPTPSPTTGPSTTPSPTATPTMTPTPSPSATATPTPSISPTPTPSSVSTPTPTPSPTSTPTPTLSATPTPSPTSLITPTPSSSSSPRPSPSGSPSAFNQIKFSASIFNTLFDLFRHK